MEIKLGLKVICLLLLLIGNFPDAIGRQLQAGVEFQYTQFDFKDVVEADQVLKHQYQFVITGKDSIAVIEVLPSCGCLIPDWDRHYLYPGDTGMIEVGFNPFNRPGKFEKKVSVLFSNGKSEKLVITGDVLSSISIAKKYPYQSSGIRYEKRRFLFNGIEPLSEKPFTIRLLNDSENVVEIDSGLTQQNSRFLLDAEKWSMQPGESIAIDGMLTASEMAGYNEYGLQIFFANSDIDLISIDVVTNVVEKLNRESGSLISFDRSILNFGEIVQGTVVNKTIEVINAGSETLIISEIKSNCSCLTTDDKSLKLKAGTKYYLDLVLDTSEIDGNQQKGIHFYSNASNGALQQLMVKVKVVK